MVSGLRRQRPREARALFIFSPVSPTFVPHPLAMLAPPLPFLTIAGAALRAWPLDLNEMAVDARFLFQRAGVSRARQHSQGEKAGSENGSESSHEAPLSMTRRERVQCGTHSEISDRCEGSDRLPAILPQAL